MGRFVATVRRLSSGFQDEVRDVLGEPRDAFNAALGDFGAVARVRRPVRQIINSALTSPAPSPAEQPEAATPAPGASSGTADQSAGPGHPDDPSLN